MFAGFVVGERRGLHGLSNVLGGDGVFRQGGGGFEATEGDASVTGREAGEGALWHPGAKVLPEERA